MLQYKKKKKKVRRVNKICKLKEMGEKICFIQPFDYGPVLATILDSIIPQIIPYLKKKKIFFGRYLLKIFY